MAHRRFLVVGYVGVTAHIVGSFRRSADAFRCATAANGYDRVEVADTMARRGEWQRWKASGYPLEFRPLTD